MTVVFVVCAAVGATVLVLQFLLALAGLGGDALGVDVPHDFGHDLGGAGHDFGADDVHGDVGHDGSVAGEHAEDHAQFQHAPAGHLSRGTTWLFQMFSLRTITSGLAFFGLAGLAADAARCAPLPAADRGRCRFRRRVRGLRHAPGHAALQAEGTARIHRAVGELATVYLRIPARQKGAGKIQINLQNRTMEYLATTPGDAIPSGATVVVTKVLGPDTVQVQPVARSKAHGDGEVLRLADHHPQDL